jgi:hypothetical protein
MNFKAFALAATLTVGSIFGGVAEAAPTTCAYIDDRNGNFVEMDCDMSQRINSNGDRVMDVVLFGPKGSKRMSIVWWQRNGQHTYAEVFMDGQRDVAKSYTAKNGAWCLNTDSGVRLCID